MHQFSKLLEWLYMYARPKQLQITISSTNITIIIIVEEHIRIETLVEGWLPVYIFTRYMGKNDTFSNFLCRNGRGQNYTKSILAHDTSKCVHVYPGIAYMYKCSPKVTNPWFLYHIGPSKNVHSWCVSFYSYLLIHEALLLNYYFRELHSNGGSTLWHFTLVLHWIFWLTYKIQIYYLCLQPFFSI